MPIIQGPKPTSVRARIKYEVDAAKPGFAPVLAPVPEGPISRKQDSVFYRAWARIIHFFTHMQLKPANVAPVGAERADEVLKVAKPGDVLLRRTEYTSSNAFIPSYWKHAAVYVGDGKVVEAIGTGVRISTLATFLEDGQHAIVVRPKGISADEGKLVATWAEAQLGKPYDFAFDFDGDDRFACTELAAKALNRGLARDVIKPDWKGTVTGDTFIHEGMQRVWSSD